MAVVLNGFSRAGLPANRQAVPFLRAEHPERYETRSLSGLLIFIKNKPLIIKRYKN